MMGNIYQGTGWGKTPVGEYDGGTIYSGTGWNKTPIGEYDSGTIYRGTGWSKTALGEYDGGTIYSGTGWNKTPIGEYTGGTVYSGTGWNKTPIGEYTGSDAGAAALLLLNFSSGSGSSDSGGMGFLEAMIKLVLLIIVTIIKIIRPIIKPLALYYMVPTMVSMTWVSFALIFLSAIGLPPILAFIVMPIMEICFFPYWISMIIHGVRKHVTTRQLLSYYGKWFLKGPLAYKDLMALKAQLDNQNSQPHSDNYAS